MFRLAVLSARLGRRPAHGNQLANGQHQQSTNRAGDVACHGGCFWRRTGLLGQRHRQRPLRAIPALTAAALIVTGVVLPRLLVPGDAGLAVYALLLTGGSLNVYSQIGLVLLVGIMAKSGILIVEFADQLRERGRTVREAIEEATIVRLRPVMMTMIATVLGGLPLVLAQGAGAEAREVLGWIIVGGLGLATLAALYVTPVAYLLFAGFARSRAAETEMLWEEIRGVSHPGPLMKQD